MGEWTNRRLFNNQQEYVWQSQQPIGSGGNAWQISTIRPHMMEAIRRYIDHGAPVGSFLRAVIAHDLFEAFATADEANSTNLYAFVDYFHNEVPIECHGSRQVYEDWVAKHSKERAIQAKHAAEKAAVEGGE